MFNVSIIDKSIDGVIILKFVHKQIDFSLAAASCYLEPENSPWGRNAESYFAHLLNIIYSYCDIDCFAICGDFNSRIGVLNDIIPDMKNSEI